MPSWRLILLGIIAAAAVSYHVYAIHAARNDGERTVRLQWKEAELKAIAQAEAQRKAAQAKINEIENRYLADRAKQASKMADLEAALEAERLNDAPVNPACPPAVSRRLSERLNSIGR